MVWGGNMLLRSEWWEGKVFRVKGIGSVKVLKWNECGGVEEKEIVSGLERGSWGGDELRDR